MNFINKCENCGAEQPSWMGGSHLERRAWESADRGCFDTDHHETMASTLSDYPYSLPAGQSSMRRVLVTGSRSLADPGPVYRALWAQARIAGSLDQLTVVEGRCPYGGADLQAQRFCEEYGVINEPFPALWHVPCGPSCFHKRTRKDGTPYYSCAGFIRNQRMVDSGADVCLAFPRGESKGTYDCAKRAKTALIPVIFG